MSNSIKAIKGGEILNPVRKLKTSPRLPRIKVKGAMPNPPAWLMTGIKIRTMPKTMPYALSSLGDCCIQRFKPNRALMLL